MAYYVSHAPLRTRTGALDHVRARTNPLRRLWRLWRQSLRERRLAAQFTDRDLWDVGLTRGDIYREFRRPFWQAVTRGRDT